VSIKYYHLAKDEEPPDEFCAVRDVVGEPSEYMFYEPESENAKLRELVRHLRKCTRHNVCAACAYADDACDFDYDMRELGVEVDG